MINEKTREKTSEKIGDLTRENIVSLIKKDSKITTNDIARKLNLTSKGIEWQIKILKENKIIERIGGRKDGYWKIIKSIYNAMIAEKTAVIF